MGAESDFARPGHLLTPCLKLVICLLIVQMLMIHELRQCGIPVIIEGETGVGKTALINVLSKLWNHTLIDEWRKLKGRILQELYKKSWGK